MPSIRKPRAVNISSAHRSSDHLLESLLDEENDAVRRDFELDHPGWQVEPAVAVLARQGIELSPVLDPQALVLRTDVHGTDAFYAVRWLRPA